MAIQSIQNQSQFQIYTTSNNSYHYRDAFQLAGLSASVGIQKLLEHYRIGMITINSGFYSYFLYISGKSV